MRKVNRISKLERKYVKQVLDNGFKSSKSYEFVTKLEKEFSNKYGIKHAIAMVNGTATLHACLEAAGVSVGDEVICPPLTMSSTSISVLHANATPVFADVDPETFLICPKEIEKVITKKTKAIITVSLYGLSPEMDKIMLIAKKHNLIVIEDNAQCFLGKYKNKYVGTFGHMASYSFQSSKHISSGEGGIVITNNDDLALKLRRYSGIGYGSIGLDKGRITKKDIQDPDYKRHVVLGWNYRPSDLIGAVACAQTERMEELVNVRIRSAEAFAKVIKNCNWLKMQKFTDEYKHSFWTFVLKIENKNISWYDFRDKFIEYGGDGVYSAWSLSYLEPVFLNKTFLNREKFVEKTYHEGLCPVAEEIQPKLLQFKTNYWNYKDAIKQSKILKKTIDFFESTFIQ